MSLENPPQKLPCGSVVTIQLDVLMYLYGSQQSCYKAVVFFFFFSYAYTTSPAAVMKLVVFFRSSKPSLHD